MSLFTEENKGLSFREWLPILSLLFGGLYLINRSEQPRAAFIHQSGRVIYLSQINPTKQKSDPNPKSFYLKLEGYAKIFELFVGTDKGDFSPRINRLTELNVGDKVDLYFDVPPKGSVGNMNRLLQYLDKNGEQFYLRSNVEKYLGYFIIGCFGLIGLWKIYKASA